MPHQKMKNQLTNKLIVHPFHFFLLTVFILSLNSCALRNLIKNADKAVNESVQLLSNTTRTIDEAIKNLNADASNFTSIMEEAIDEVKDNDVKNQLQDALNNAIVTTSSEVRCDIQFTGDYLKKQLQIIKAKLTHKPIPVSAPVTCNVVPSAIDMNRPPNSRNQVAVTGYFLNEDFSKYQLWLYSASVHGSPGVSGAPGAPGSDGAPGKSNNGKGLTKTNVTRYLSLSTDYKLTINLGNNGIRLNDKSNKLQLLWNGELVSEILVIQPVKEPCDLKERQLNNLAKMVLS